MKARMILSALSLLAMLPALPSSGAEQQMMRPRVPSEQLESARAMTNPLAATPEVIEQGKGLYEGKGGCLNCHGPGGGGDGPVAAALDPSPRDFRHHGFWRHRTEGELHWVIKHGIAGTAMVGFSESLMDEEIWALIRYERTFAEDRRGHMGPRGGPEHGGMRGMHQENECCGRPEASR